MDRFVLSLLLCSLEMSAVALVYMALLRALKHRQSPVLRYYSWLVIIVGFLIPIKPTLGRTALTVTEPAPYVTPLQLQNAEQNVNSYDIAFVIWLLAAVGYLLTYFCRYRLFRRSIARLSRFADEHTREIAEQTAEALGMTASVRVVIMSEISSPMMTGLLSPLVMLPDRQFSEDDLRLILKHELTHFKHRDLWLRLVFTVCRAVHWFNPIMPFISRSLDEECEHYCDYSVVSGESIDLKKRYCQSILGTVAVQSRSCKKRVRLVMATNFYTPKQGLKHRLSLIISDRRRKKYVLAGAVAAVLTIASGSVIGFAAADRAETAENTVMTTTTSVHPNETAPVTTTMRPVETTTTTSRAESAPPVTAMRPVDTTTVTAQEPPSVTTIAVYDDLAETTTMTVRPRE